MTRQLEFFDLDQTLQQTRFLVLDIETTGCSPLDSEMVELGAVLVQGGTIIGSYQSLIRPSCCVPTEISVLTGIYPQMLKDAPSCSEVIGKFLEFAQDSVLVGHNLRFDLSFINSALAKHSELLKLDNPTLDTLSIARKLLVGEVSNFKLSTLTRELGLAHQSQHRAMADVLATVDLLHYLIERATDYGISYLEELKGLPNRMAQRHLPKLRACNYLPRRTGVYWIEDQSNNVIYVGKALDLNSRFRSYFSSENRRKVDPLLATMASISYMTFASELEALIAEARLIKRLSPRFNHQGKLKESNYRTIAIGWDCATNNPTSKLLRSSDGVPPETVVIGPFRSLSSARLAEAALGRSLAHLRRSAFYTQPISMEPVLRLDLVSGHLWAKLKALADLQCFEEAEMLRIGANYLILAMIRQASTLALQNLGFLQLKSLSSNAELALVNGQIALNPIDSARVELGTGTNRFRRTANALDVTALLGVALPRSSKDTPDLEVFEELWILWKHLTGDTEFEIKEISQPLSQPISSAHHCFVPRGTSNTDNQGYSEAAGRKRIEPARGRGWQIWRSVIGDLTLPPVA